MTVPVSELVRAVLDATPLIDGHNDVPWQLRRRFGNDLAQFDFRDTTGLQPPMHVDLKRLRAGGVGGQCLAAYVPIEDAGPGAAAVMYEQLQVARDLVAAYPEDLGLALSADDIEHHFAARRIACLLAVEGGHGLENSIDHLRGAFEAGARYLTLVHNIHTEWADCCRCDPLHGGLTDFGRDLVAEMNRLGMLIDLSHAAATTMRDVLATSAAPVACTHSGARAVNDYPRNVDDATIAAIAAGGGIVMATFVPYFVSAEVLEQRADRAARVAWLQEHHPDEPGRRAAALRAWDAAHPKPAATLQQVADHVDHIRSIAGIEHVGLGSDFDGIDEVPVGLEDASTFPALLEELHGRGYTRGELEALAGGNFLRVLRAVEAAAR
jgi:membrane dipeptidase